MIARAAWLASLFVLGACNGTIQVTFATGPQEVEISDVALTLPAELDDGDGRVASVACGPSGMCPPSSEITLTCEAGICDPAPRTLTAPVGEVIDTNALIAETREIGVRSIESYSIDRVHYAVSLNTLTLGVGPFEVFWGPGSASAIDPAMGVHRFGEIPRIEAGTSPTGELEIDPEGMDALSTYLVDTGTRVRFFARTEVDLEPGDPLPRGSLRATVNVTMTAVGRVL